MGESGSNRTIVGLKESVKDVAERVGLKQQSHHCGIERFVSAVIVDGKIKAAIAPLWDLKGLPGTGITR